MSSHPRVVAAVVLLVLVAAACGGGDDAATSTGPDEITTTDATTTTAAAAGTTAAPSQSSETGPPVDGDLVSVHYTGTLDSGEEFDSSRDRDPLQFVVGSGQVITGFDTAVRELMVGESVTVRLQPVDAYGETDPERILEFPIEEVPEEFREVGMEVMLGGTTPATIIGITDATVTVDANHPLAGEALTFDIELVEITSS